MSENKLVYDFPSKINLPKSLACPEELAAAVNEVLYKYCYKTQFNDVLFFYNLGRLTIKNNEDSVMLLESRTLNEFHVGLQEKCIVSAINSVTDKTFPHYKGIQEFIKFLMNGCSESLFGLIEELFFKIILCHPPQQNMLDYYHTILSDCYIKLNGKCIAKQGFFSCLLEALINCLKEYENVQSSHNYSTFKKISKLKISEFSCENLIGDNSNEKNSTCFDELDWHEKVKRCLIALNFAYNILETDFAYWLNSRKFKFHSPDRDHPPLTAGIFWPEKKNLGLINKEIRKILKVYVAASKLKNLQFLHVDVIGKMVKMLAEVIRCVDPSKDSKYPFLGTNSTDLARELSLCLYELLDKDSNNDKEDINQAQKVNELIQTLKPPWFRLHVCSHLLSYLTGHQCEPELIEVYDILEHIVEGKQEEQTTESKVLEKLKAPANPEIIDRLRRIKNINSKRCKGRTVLQVACEINNVEEVKALLTFPDLDINATDRDGWTALHIASYKGHEDCVRVLLFSSAGNCKKSAKTRAKGPDGSTPLMCAVTGSHVDVCLLLLEHSGSVLLEDVNDSNQMAQDLSKSEEISRILSHYQKNHFRTSRVCEMHIDEKHNLLVMKLCVEMVQSYLCTYRTWDVYESLNKIQNHASANDAVHDTRVYPEWNYNRFQKDINVNIPKLQELFQKLDDIGEFEYEIFKRILRIKKK